MPGPSGINSVNTSAIQQPTLDTTHDASTTPASVPKALQNARPAGKPENTVSQRQVGRRTNLDIAIRQMYKAFKVRQSLQDTKSAIADRHKSMLEMPDSYMISITGRGAWARNQQALQDAEILQVLLQDHGITTPAERKTTFRNARYKGIALEMKTITEKATALLTELDGTIGEEAATIVKSLGDGASLKPKKVKYFITTSNVKKELSLRFNSIIKNPEISSQDLEASLVSFNEKAKGLIKAFSQVKIASLEVLKAAGISDSDAQTAIIAEPSLASFVEPLTKLAQSSSSKELHSAIDELSKAIDTAAAAASAAGIKLDEIAQLRSEVTAIAGAMPKDTSIG